jgi:hypothetical protein
MRIVWSETDISNLIEIRQYIEQENRRQPAEWRNESWLRSNASRNILVSVVPGASLKRGNSSLRERRILFPTEFTGTDSPFLQSCTELKTEVKISESRNDCHSGFSCPDF